MPKYPECLTCVFYNSGSPLCDSCEDASNWAPADDYGDDDEDSDDDEGALRDRARYNSLLRKVA